MMMMMMRMGGNVPHLDFDFVDGEMENERCFSERSRACVSVLQGESAERNDISKQNNQTLTLVRTLTTKARYLFSTTHFSNLSFVSTFNSITVKASMSVNFAPLKPFFFFFFFVGDFLLEKKNSVL